MFDLFTSPNDPAFFFHHSNVDRMWTIWQQRNAAKRQFALNGTVLNYDPPSAPLATLKTLLNWDVLGKAKQIKEVMSNEAFEYNYVYEDMQG